MRLSPKQREALRIVAEGRFYPELVKEDDGWHARWRAVGVDNGWVDEYVREAAMTRLSEDAEEQKHETLHDAWMMALKSRTGLVCWDDAECEAFAAELREWSGNAAEDVAARAAIAFRLERTGESFVVRCRTPKGRRGLRALGQAMFVFPPLRGLRADGEELRVTLSHAEAESFVRSGARDLRDASYGVEGVDLSAAITVMAELCAGEAAPRAKGGVPLELKIKVAGETVTAEELRFLMDQGSSLVYFRDRWIEIDRNLLRQALRALSKSGGRVENPVSFALGIGRIGNLEIEEIRAHGWLRGLLNELRAGKAAASIPSSTATLPGLDGTLRDYQARGVAWLRFLTGNGFGALLADDMGLGKTIQTIAWALGEKPPLLVVAPLTLLSNWQHEFARFAPGLRVYVHQGDRRHIGSGFMRTVAACDVVITSYNLLQRDYTAFSEVAWNALVLDEAQLIKNPDTQVARAVRALTPPKRIALTGTPIENSVADVWSIEEFLNPGFLGDRKSFTERFVRPLAMDEQSVAGKRLRHALEPFVLRRLKSDQAIAAELGPKREIKEYCRLDGTQRQAYELALEDFRVSEHRQGDVFALLTRLKLICDGMLGDEMPTAVQEDTGGKLARLEELVEQVFAGGESCLIFTQYAKVGALLKERLEARFGRAIPFLHGGLGVRERERQIALFNGTGAMSRARPAAFVLSLKAGGFGLNLTKATHVIHYDRWWNPAVENQATDRAHRIGQTKTVFVHQFIAAGTLEEHVDQMLERKSRVAGTLVQSGESFLSSLDERELLEAVALDDAP